MATATHLPLAEYLETSYRPDREYIDGELLERNVGKYEHARVQALLSAWFVTHEAEWSITVTTDQRVQVAPTRVRIPDLAVMRLGPQPDILDQPPLLVIEILSPGDTFSDTIRRADDYRTMGIETVWIIDPQTRSGRMCLGPNWHTAARLEVPGTPLYVELESIFAQIGERRP